MKGIDVSTFQGDINWDKVKADGVEFAIIRGGYGNQAFQIDDMLIKNLEGALSAGVKCGIYWFSYAISADDAVREADVCDSIIKNYKDRLSLPVFYDFEYDSDRYARAHGVIPDKVLITDMTIAFMERMVALGYDTGFYTNIDYSENKYDMARLVGYKLWMAYYVGKKYDGAYIQQTASDGSVAGIDGNVDMNILYGDITEEPTTAPVTPDPATTGSVYTVKAGDTLSGIASKYNVTVGELVALNGIQDPNLIFVGQQIKITGTADTSNKVYTVKAGDTLSAIASKYNVTVAELAALNGIQNPNLIFVDQQIKILDTADTTNNVYTVKPGDTLSGIAAKYNTTYQTIANVNGISNPNVIYAGQQIKIP